MKMNKELLKGSSPILVLSLLKQGDMYGYQMISKLKNQSGCVFEMKEGTLYPILHSLEQDGAVTSYWQEAGGRKRRYYHLSPKGKQLLEEKQKEWNVYVTAVNQVMGGALCE